MGSRLAVLTLHPACRDRPGQLPLIKLRPVDRTVATLADGADHNRIELTPARIRDLAETQTSQDQELIHGAGRVGHPRGRAPKREGLIIVEETVARDLLANDRSRLDVRCRRCLEAIGTLVDRP